VYPLVSIADDAVDNVDDVAGVYEPDTTLATNNDSPP
jgi:hypothetical protein